MSRETQLDTHDIDKLLDDDDFIDDFDFSDDLGDEFAGAEDPPAPALGGDSEEENVLDEFVFDEESGEGGTAAAQQSPPKAELEVELDLDFDNFELGSDRAGKRGDRLLPMIVGLVVLLWLLQLGGVIYLLRRPVVIRDQVRPIAAEAKVKSAPGERATAAEPMAVVAHPESPAEPDIFVFTTYVKLYSLDGLKVFSVEVEVVQYQEDGRLTDPEKIMLKETLRQAFAESVSGHMREEVVDLNSRLMAIIVPCIEKFFSDRGVDLEKIKIRVHNPFIQ